MRDLIDGLQPGTPYVATTSDNTVASATVNLLGYNSCAFLIGTGVLADADATFAVTMKESDTGAFGGEETDVPAAYITGGLANAGFDFSKDNASFKVGYVGLKLYVKLLVTPTNNTGSAPIAIIPLRGQPGLRPTVNPPA